MAETMIYRRDGRPDVKCTIERVRQTGSTIYNIVTGERSPGVKLLLKPIDGGRAFWSATMRAVDEAAKERDET